MDSNLSSNVDSWALMSQMLDIVKPFMPVPGHPLGDEIEDAILRELMSTCMSISLASLVHKSVEDQRAFARNCIALFDLKGWKYFSGLEEAAAKSVSNGHEGEGDDLQPGTSKCERHTGLDTDGTTCFQNSAFFALVSSPAFMRRLRNLDRSPSDGDVYSAAYEIAARDAVQDMLIALFENRKQDSLKLLHKFWAAQNAVPAGSRLGLFRPGHRNDPNEFLLTCLSPMLGDLLPLVWGLKQVEEVICSICHGSRERHEETLNLFLPVAQRGTLDLVYLLNDYFLDYNIGGELLFDCDQCGKNIRHAQLSRLDHDGKGDILVSLNLTQPAPDAVDTVGVQEHVGLPFDAFPVAGPDCLFFVKYILATKGSTTEDRHFFGFGREPPSCASRIAKAAEFDTFRKYDDACLTSNVSFETVTKDLPYQVLISPIRHVHFVALCAREISSLRATTVSVIATTLEARERSSVDDPTAVFSIGPIFTAVTAELCTIFERVAGQQLAKLTYNNMPAVTVSAAIWDRLLASPHLAGRISVRRLEKLRNGKGTMKDLFDIRAMAAVVSGWHAATEIDYSDLAAACLHDIVFMPELIGAFLREVAHDHIRMQRETQRCHAVRQWKLDIQGPEMWSMIVLSVSTVCKAHIMVRSQRVWWQSHAHCLKQQSMELLLPLVLRPTWPQRLRARTKVAEDLGAGAPISDRLEIRCSPWGVTLFEA
ncbi:Ubiquitin carboxyl-terminal hydrolase 38 [Elasticomyces elasticus]|nr:Ubiquitin carboxyl-terminal hydrolase 38 [Elasticomyces elasticus]